ncbi:hypothetical protein QJS10_CPB18g00710 [Acorus calamus]|uniref:Uncharacterized protein n=1 Tax=Acorus calamus TaxID=4465 RepID=A0AAV9CQK3_ACOCL|nr:hypothetical protein QJS10_CPB18g00710 [Acorus calamus]
METEKYTFYLRNGEMTITLHDVSILLGLQIEGCAVTRRVLVLGLLHLFIEDLWNPESIIQNLQLIEFESPLLLPIQDQVISMPVKPTLMVSDDPHLGDDKDLDQLIEYVLESEPLIFRNTQFKGAVELSQLPKPLDLPSKLSEEPPLSDSTAISKSIIPYLAHEPLIAPFDEYLPSPSLGPQHYGEPCSLAPIKSTVAPTTCVSISTSLLTKPPLRKDSLPAKGIRQIKRHSHFRQCLGIDIFMDAVRVDAEQEWLRRRQTRFKVEENRYTMNDT